jgi:hypothetical protein
MVKVDDGIDIISRAKWKTFGKFIINHNELDNQKFKIRYLSGSQVPKLSNTTVSNEFSSLLSHLLDTKQINYELIKQLTDKETTPKPAFLFEPYHAVDYFASQGIKLKEE